MGLQVVKVNEMTNKSSSIFQFYTQDLFVNRFRFHTYVLCAGAVSKFTNLSVYHCPLPKLMGTLKDSGKRKISVIRAKDNLI